ncbi:uncharacterized protein DEA37_0014832, partial [Paragonimus westermani]
VMDYLQGFKDVSEDGEFASFSDFKGCLDSTTITLLYDAHPRIHRLTNGEVNDSRHLFEYNTPTAELEQYAADVHGKYITIMDICNIRHRLKPPVIGRFPINRRWLAEYNLPKISMFRQEVTAAGSDIFQLDDKMLHHGLAKLHGVTPRTGSRVFKAIIAFTHKSIETAKAASPYTDFSPLPSWSAKTAKGSYNRPHQLSYDIINYACSVASTSNTVPTPTLKRKHRPRVAPVFIDDTSEDEFRVAWSVRLEKYNFEIGYTPDKNIVPADTLSRTPLATEKDNCSGYDQVYLTLAESDSRPSRIRQTFAYDEEMEKIEEQIRNGWPDNARQVSEIIRPHFRVRCELTTENGLVFHGERLNSPRAARKLTMQEIHRSHLSVGSCTRRAEDTVYWPGMTSHIEDFVSTCTICKQYGIGQSKEPMVCRSVPKRLWQHVAVDLFSHADKSSTSGGLFQ